MAKNLGIEVKRFDLAELASRDFTRALTPTNIKDGFRQTRIWPLNYDALMHDVGCRKSFHVDGHEDVYDAKHVDGQEDVDDKE